MIFKVAKSDAFKWTQHQVSEPDGPVSSPDTEQRLCKRLGNAQANYMCDQIWGTDTPKFTTKANIRSRLW